MYVIAICDDETRELDKMEEFIKAYQRMREDNMAFDYRTERFESAESLLYQICEKGFLPDFMILDIFMPGETGMDAVKKLRKKGCRVPVAFLSSSEQFALDAYGVDAVQYLVKPLEREKFFHMLDIFCEMLGEKQQDKEKKCIMVKATDGIRKIGLGNIVYCETQKNYQILHLEDEECRVRMTSGKMHELLGKYRQFSKCGSSYIFNVEHIVTVDREKIYLDNGNRIYIPRNRVVEFKESYFSYYFENTGVLDKNKGMYVGGGEVC